jgi:hypothetical protein
MRRRQLQVATAVWLCLALASLSACGKKDNRPGRVPVSGVVLQQGQPVAEATVVFEPQGTMPAATGKTDAGGRFQLTTFEPSDGAVPGEYKVAIQKVQVIPGKTSGAIPDDYVGPPPDEKWLLPAKYGSTATSGFTATVQTGATNDFKFDLSE